MRSWDFSIRLKLKFFWPIFFLFPTGSDQERAPMPIAKKTSTKKNSAVAKKPTSLRPSGNNDAAVKQALKKRKAEKIKAVLKSKRPDQANSESASEEEERAEEELDQKKMMDFMRRQFEEQFGKVEGLPEPEEESEEEENDSEAGSGSDSDEKVNEADPDSENDSDLDLEMEEYEHYNEESEEEDSGSESDEGPVVVKHVESGFKVEASKQDKKLFLSSKAPIQEAKPEPKRRQNASEPDEDERQNLDNDLALQRLIKESHILADAGLSGVDISTGVIGKARHKTLDSRLDDLGLKKKKEGQMPMKMRQALSAHQQKRKDRHVAQAKEAGIILARSATAKESKKKPAKRERGLKINSVGRETKHGIIISKSEIAKYSGTGGKKGRR